jgi:CBS domain-containing protein
VDSNGSLRAVLSRTDIFAALEAAPSSTAIDVGVRHPVTIHADELLSAAADRMIRHSIGRLPVVDRSAEPKLVGLVTRRAILEAKRRQMNAERH